MAILSVHTTLKWWLALVMEKCNAQEELKVRFFHPAGPSPSFSFPRRLDELVINRAQVQPNHIHGSSVQHSQCRWAASYTFTKGFVETNCIVDKI